MREVESSPNRCPKCQRVQLSNELCPKCSEKSDDRISRPAPKGH